MARKPKAKPKGSRQKPAESTVETPEASGEDEQFVITSAADLAKCLGLHRVTVQDYLNKGLPGTRAGKNGEGGRFYLPEVIAWLRENVWQPRRERTADDLETEKLRVDIATKTLKLQHMAGKLVDRKAEKADRMRVYHIIRNRLDAVPRELANLLPPDLQADFLIDAGNIITLIQKELTVVDGTD